MFTVGLVHTRDHGPRCSIAGVQNLPQGVQEVGLILCPFRNITGGKGASAPLGTPGGPQVEPKVLVAKLI